MRNAATSPLLWAFCAVPVLTGVYFRDNTAACWLMIIITAILYDIVYRRLTSFRWSLLGLRLSR